MHRRSNSRAPHDRKSWFSRPLAIEPLERRELLALTIGVNFTGSKLFTDSGSIPPDTNGAVGIDHFVEMINGRFSVYDKASGDRVKTSSLNAFWQDAGLAGKSGTFDPRIAFDHASQRWFAASVDNARAANNFLLATSNSSDPTGNWTAFQIDSDPNDTRWADFPGLGLDADGVYLAANMFGISGGTSTRATIVSVPKADLLLASPTVANRTAFFNESLSTRGFALQPAVDYGASDGRGAILAVDADFFSRLNRTDVLGAGAAGASLSSTVDISVDATSFPPDADQPGGKLDLDTGDERFSSSVYEVGDSLWAVHTIDVSGRAGLRWYEIDETDNAVLQSGTVADASLAFFEPSIAANAFGDVVIGFSGTSPDQFASSYAVLGQTVAGVTTFGAPQLLKEGVSDYQQTGGGSRNRWGDYSATTVSPSNPREFWTIQEWVSATDTWATQITQLFALPPDIRMSSVTADGSGTLLVSYDIANADVAPFDVGVYTSADAAFDAADSVLATLHVANAADLAVGAHAISFAIGDGAGQVPLPGAGAAETDSDYYVLAVADPTDAIVEDDLAPISEDNRAVFAGAYHLPTGDVLVHGAATDDAITVAPDLTLTIDGTTHGYTAAEVASFRIRAHDGADLVDGVGVAKAFRIFGGAGDDVLAGGLVSDRTTGGAGADTWIVRGTGLAETMSVVKVSATQLKATRGADVDLFDFDAADRLHLLGGAGNDTLSLGATLTVPATLEGEAGNDTLLGGAAVDVLLGGDGNDWLEGRGANDRYDGGAGTDTYAQTGNTTAERYSLDWDSVAAWLVGKRESPIGTVVETDSAVFVERIRIASQAGDDLVDLADLDAADMAAAGLKGSDLLGGAGNDTLIGTPGIDSLKGEAGNDTLFGAAGNDTLDGGLGDDFLDGGDGVDIASQTGDGSSERFHVDWDPVAARLVSTRESPPGTPVETDHAVGAERVRIYGQAGDDLIDLSALDAADMLAAGLLGALLYGGLGNDAISGTVGADTIFGEAGNDWLWGGLGNDTLTGGDGDDEFVFRGSSANDSLSLTQPSSTQIKATRKAAGGSVVLETDRFNFVAGDRLLVEGLAGDDALAIATAIALAGTADGGDGIDSCVAPVGWTIVNCEP